MIEIFIDELRKIAEEPGKETRFQRFMHHPLVQGLGYGALATEGAHALAERGTFGKSMQARAHRPMGRALGVGSIGTSAAFLGGEGIAALQNLFKRKKPVAQAQPPVEKTAAAAPSKPRVVYKNRFMYPSWKKQLVLQLGGGALTSVMGAGIGWQVRRSLDNLNRKEEELKARERLTTIANIAKKTKSPLIVKV